jgi:hypothetical protein
MSDTTSTPTTPPTRTPEHQRKHREIQAGRLTLVVVIGWAWFGSGFVNNDPTHYLVGLVLAAAIPGAVWLWLAHQSGRLRERRFWIGVAKGVAILIVLDFLGSMIRSS